VTGGIGVDAAATGSADTREIGLSDGAGFGRNPLARLSHF
jgi:hypothetical protein